MDILYNLSLRPDKDAEVCLSVPEGTGVPYYDAASKQIKFRTRPESWKDALCMLYGKNVALCADDGSVYETALDMDSDMVFADKETAEAFIALAKLKMLNRMWRNDYISSGDNIKPLTWAVKHLYDIDGEIIFCAVHLPEEPQSLMFPTLEMANEFIDTFKDLFEKAKAIFK